MKTFTEREKKLITRRALLLTRLVELDAKLGRRTRRDKDWNRQ